MIPSQAPEVRWVADRDVVNDRARGPRSPPCCGGRGRWAVRPRGNHLKASGLSSATFDRFSDRRSLLVIASLCVLGLAAYLGTGAPSATAADSCPNAAIRSQQSSAFLPECRAYEKVSPAPKGGYNAHERGTQSASPDGNAINWTLNGPSPDAVGGGVGTELLADRDPVSGWGSQPISPPFPPGGFYTVFPPISSSSVDKSTSVVQSFSALTSEGTEGADQLYVGSPGSYQLITPQPGLVSPPFPQPTLLGKETYVDGTADDLKTVAYETPVDEFSPESFGTLSTYLWHDGSLERVGELDGGVVPPTGTRIGSSPSHGSLVGALSADGRRTFFHVIEPGVDGSGSVAGQLYVHQVGGPTEHVSASARTAPDPAGPLPAFFVAAERQRGDSVLFTSCEKLTNDSTADASADEELCSQGLASGTPNAKGNDLYQYDVDDKALTDLTTQDPEGANVYGVVGTSDDLSKIYFVAGGVLAANPGARGATAVSGEPNLYLSDEGAVSFLGILSSANLGGVGVSDWENWSASTFYRLPATRVSPDGDALLFVSRAQLDSYENASPRCGSGSCSEVYLYRRGAGIECVSCPALSATAPSGDAELMSLRNGFHSPDPLPRNLQDGGELIYFQTFQSLTPGDSNGRRDVYQRRDGQLSLISAGTGNSDSYFAEASAGGDDVFLVTFDRLVGDDLDRQSDMYDARIDGGFSEPAAPPAVCEGDGCQRPPAITSGPTAAGSSAFVGSGNQKVKRKHRKRRHMKHHESRKNDRRHHDAMKGTR